MPFAAGSDRSVKKCRRYGLEEYYRIDSVQGGTVLYEMLYDKYPAIGGGQMEWRTSVLQGHPKIRLKPGTASSTSERLY